MPDSAGLSTSGLRRFKDLPWSSVENGPQTHDSVQEPEGLSAAGGAEGGGGNGPDQGGQGRRPEDRTPACGYRYSQQLCAE